MASLGTEAKTGRRLIQFFGKSGKRQTFRLGKVTLKQAETVRLYVEDLVACSNCGTSPKATTVAWIANLDETMRDRLERVGLAAVQERLSDMTVAAWVRSYIDGRTDVKPNTMRNFEQTYNSVVAFFKGKQMKQVTPGDAADFRVFLRGRKMSEGTTRRRCKRVRQFFADAVKRNVLASNPFSGLRCGTYASSDRFHFVTREEADRVLAACPDAEWRLLFALCRYGGLRCPSEILTLRWQDIDWKRARFTVHASKTEHQADGGVRIVPLFPELLPYLQDCLKQATPDAVRVITKHRDANANLRTQLARIVKKAGLTPWPKLFQNLRSTRETELAEKFPIHVVCKWLGTTTQIASKHYLQITEDHYSQASNTSPRSAAESGAQAVQNAVQQAAAGNRGISQPAGENDRKDKGQE